MSNKQVVWSKRVVKGCFAGFLVGIFLGCTPRIDEDAQIMTVATNYYQISTEPETTQETEVDFSDYDETTEPVEEKHDPVVFCGLSDPDFAITLSDEEALSFLTLVNRCYRVASSFSPADLVVVDVPGVNFPPNGVHELRKEVADALEAMFAATVENGLNLLLSSAYRSYDQQVFFHNLAINRAGGNVEEARRWSAIPGHSEHQLGLGVDLTTPELEGLGWLHNSFSHTPEGIWVRENAHYFGFIISFPYGREKDVAIAYEPWHIRYVGIDVATEMFNNNQILEEFLWYNSQ